MPKFTLYFIILSSMASLALIISSLVLESTFNGSIFSYLALVPKSLITKGYVWQFISSYLVNNSFWALIFVTMQLWLLGADIEQKLGTKRYIVLLVISLLINSIANLLIASFFGLVISSITYFNEMWYRPVMIGSMPMMVFMEVFSIRANQMKTRMFCCFNMPVWGYLIILIIMCQLMMYPPWYAIFYNTLALAIAYIIPISLFKTENEQIGIEMGQTQQITQQNGTKFTTMNTVETKKVPTAKFSGGGRKL